MDGGIEEQFQVISALNQDASSTNYTAADQIVKYLQFMVPQAQNYETGTMQPLISSANKALTTLAAAIAQVQQDLPGPPPGSFEFSTWYIDWTSFTFPVPPSYVKTVNIFVGEIALDAQGNPVIDGFDDMDLTSMKNFVAACASQGQKVKISLGGSTSGRYGKCWDVLTTDNVPKFAQALAAFCTSNGLAGVDFDVEEFDGSDRDNPQELLVGQLIKAFKASNPSLMTSFCANAGINNADYNASDTDGYPWKRIVQNIFDAASTYDEAGNAVCPVDRIYIMSYYNSLDEEAGFLQLWAEWMKARYGFASQQVSAGIDDKDASAYAVSDMAKLAKQNNYSMAYWEYDPAMQQASEASLQAIENGYNSGAAQALPQRSRVRGKADKQLSFKHRNRFKRLAIG
jgi:hypothetical protein